MSAVMQTLNDLGCKVRVRHYRNKAYDFETPRVNKGIGAVLVNVTYAPRGGVTTVSLQLPNGMGTGDDAYCSDKDVYCRKTGRNIALLRCLEAFANTEQEIVQDGVDILPQLNKLTQELRAELGPDAPKV